MRVRNRGVASAIGRALRPGLLVAVACGLAACTKLWGPNPDPETGSVDYPLEFCGIFFNCSHEEQYEPGGDRPEDVLSDRSWSDGKSYRF
jgi:hypothetical protein